MKRELISVITPTYNRGEKIKITINSVLNQTYKNLELLIIDDGSIDNTIEIVKSIKDKRIRIVQQEHRGIPAAENNGIKSARGSYIAIIDDDDLWLPQKLETQIKQFEKDSEILAVATNGVFSSITSNNYIILLNKNKRVSFKDLLSRNFIINSSILIKKSVFDKIGLRDETCGNAIHDYNYWLRILRFKDKSILILKERLIIKGVHESNITKISNSNTLFVKKLCKRYLYCFNKHIDFNKNIFFTPKFKGVLIKYFIIKKTESFGQKCNFKSNFSNKKFKIFHEIFLTVAMIIIKKYSHVANFLYIFLINTVYYIMISLLNKDLKRLHFLEKIFLKNLRNFLNILQ